MELLLELILGLFGELIFNLVVGTAVEFGWQSMHNSFRPARYANKWFACLGLTLLGFCLGALSALLISTRLTPILTFPGLSLLIAPLLAGAGLEVIGRQMQQKRDGAHAAHDMVGRGAVRVRNRHRPTLADRHLASAST